MSKIALVGPVDNLAYLVSEQGVKEYFSISLLYGTYRTKFPVAFERWNQTHFNPSDAATHIIRLIQHIELYHSLSMVPTEDGRISQGWRLHPPQTDLSKILEQMESRFDFAVGSGLAYGKKSELNLHKFYENEDEYRSRKLTLDLPGDTALLHIFTDLNGEKEPFQVEFDGIGYHAVFPYQFSTWEKSFPSIAIAQEYVELKVEAIKKWQSFHAVMATGPDENWMNRLGVTHVDWEQFEAGSSVNKICYWMEMHYGVSIEHDLADCGIKRKIERATSA